VTPVGAAPPVVPAVDGIARAAELISAGAVVAFPTETLYGLAVNALDPAAVEKLLAVKGRGPWQPFPCLVADRSMLALLVGEERGERLIEAHWPGPLTLVLPAVEGLPAALVNAEGGVGVRISSDPLATRLVEQAGTPLTATSANLSGRPPAKTADDARLEGVSLVLDGAVRGELASTVVEAMPGRPLRVIRQGAVVVEV
jgi:L-threonylcarbamoyladenylate synthase